ncbi:MAG TPA: hypothetical protein VGF80_06365 [Galbitalea sp.]|jgi:peptidoglycan/LPS O-acetylase OafA/YrhL
MMDSADSAADQLRAIDAGTSAGERIGLRNRPHDVLFGIVAGTVLGAMLAVVVFVFPAHTPWLTGPSSLVFGLAVGLLGTAYRVRRSGTSRITAVRYRAGFFPGILIYAAGVVVVLLDIPLPVPLWIAWVVATALPMIIASSLPVSRER